MISTSFSPRLRQGHAVLAAVKEFHPQLILKPRDNAAHVGLGIAQDLSGPGQAAAVGGDDDGQIFSHGCAPPSRLCSVVQGSFQYGLMILPLYHIAGRRHSLQLQYRHTILEFYIFPRSPIIGHEESVLRVRSRQSLPIFQAGGGASLSDYSQQEPCAPPHRQRQSPGLPLPFCAARGVIYELDMAK